MISENEGNVRRIEIRYCALWLGKKTIAARVAAQLRKERDVQVALLKGGFAEFSISIDGHRCIEASGLSYPRPSKVVQTMREFLAKEMRLDDCWTRFHSCRNQGTARCQWVIWRFINHQQNRLVPPLCRSLVSGYASMLPRRKILSLALLLVGSLFLNAEILSAQRIENLPAWTQTASACSPDDAAISKYALFDADFSFNSFR